MFLSHLSQIALARIRKKESRMNPAVWGLIWMEQIREQDHIQWISTNNCDICRTFNIMTEDEFLIYCKSQVSGPLKEEDIVLMLTAWGQIKYTTGYNQALSDNGLDSKKE